MKTYRIPQILILLFVLLLSHHSSNAQNKMNISLEALAYPTGFITGLSLDKNLGTKDYLHLKLGLNIFDHRDLGVQDDESGSGYGFTLGYRSFFNESKTKWRWGIKSDLWFNNVEWVSKDAQGNDIVGETDIIVLQPTAELSYVFQMSSFF